VLQVAKDNLVMLGVQLGRLTSHTGKFRLGIGCMDLLAQYAKYKVRSCCRTQATSTILICARAFKSAVLTSGHESLNSGMQQICKALR
jgi:hypothetical protein